MASDSTNTQSTPMATAPSPAAGPDTTMDPRDDSADKKRKRIADDDRRGTEKGGGRGGGMSRGKAKRKEMGRAEYIATKGWKRNQVDYSRQRDEQRSDYKPAIHVTHFSKEEIDAEEKRPKRKVAVMIGYAGTGYFGMQFNHDQKTIEGDLFQAFVKAGAVSKANASDPKKVSFVRCARTDKGVHAAGNIISLKLVVEDEDIVQKINDNLVPQIRVFGIERTMNSFNAYKLVDSRIYEYLIPTHCFLPPHPKSYLGKKLADLAEELGETKVWEQRQESVANFWSDVEEKRIKPILEEIEPELRTQAWEGIFEQEDVVDDEKDESVATTTRETSNKPKHVKVFSKLDEAQKRIKRAILQAKKEWRITPERLAQVQSVLSRYEGVRNFHNYTVRVQARDPSAKRVIRSFVVNDTPILIGDTEWLSMKIHGQSFMMHQIRKMVGMATLVVRCGTDEIRLQESMSENRISIPRAPGLGLLLERPIFDTYNKNLGNRQDGPERGSVGFTKYHDEVESFKQKEIYERIYREEAEANMFHQLFWAVDSLNSTQFLYLTSKGLAAVEKENKPAKEAVEALEGSSDEEDVKNEGN